MKSQSSVINPEVPVLSLVSQCILLFPPGWCPFGVLRSFPAKGF